MNRLLAIAFYLGLAVVEGIILAVPSTIGIAWFVILSVASLVAILFRRLVFQETGRGLTPTSTIWLITVAITWAAFSLVWRHRLL